MLSDITSNKTFAVQFLNIFLQSKSMRFCGAGTLREWQMQSFDLSKCLSAYFSWLLSLQPQKYMNKKALSFVTCGRLIGLFWTFCWGWSPCGLKIENDTNDKRRGPPPSFSYHFRSCKEIHLHYLVVRWFGKIKDVSVDHYRVRKNYRNSVSFFDKIQAKLDFYLLGWAISCVFMLKQHVLMVDNVIKHVQADQDKYFQYLFKF